MIKHLFNNPKNKQWCVFSKDGTKNLGCGSSEAWAKNRLRQVEYFKRAMESIPDLDTEEQVNLLDEGFLHELAGVFQDSPSIPTEIDADEVYLLGDFPDSENPGVPPVGYNLPKSWTRKSALKYWNTIGGSVTNCMTKLGGKDSAAFCASLKDYVTGTTSWRSKKKEGEEVIAELSEPFDVIHFQPIRLAEVVEDRWIDLAMEGRFLSMDGMDVKISSADLDRYVRNFTAGVRGQDVPITIDHPDRGGAAAGWFRKLRTVTREFIEGSTPKAKKVLQGIIDWTPFGREKVQNKEYRYISVELMSDALRAASLVNFPAVKGMQPVELSEGGEKHLYLTGGSIDMSNLSQAEVVEALAESIVDQVENRFNEDPKLELESDVGEKEMDEEVTEPIERLADTNDTGALLILIEGVVENKMRPLRAENVNLKAKLQEAEEYLSDLVAQAKFHEIREKVTAVSNLKSGKVLAPNIQRMLENAVLAEPAEYEDTIFELVEALTDKNAVVDLGEVGTDKTSSIPPKDTAEYSKLVDEQARQIQKDQGISYRMAAREAISQMSQSA